MLELVRRFSLIDPPSDSDTLNFYGAHPEIHCANESYPCVQTGTRLKIRPEDLKAITFDEMQQLTTQLIWLGMQVDDRVKRGKGDDLEQLLPACCGGQWVLVRGTWNQGSFKIEPEEFIFVWDGEKQAYHQYGIE